MEAEMLHPEFSRKNTALALLAAAIVLAPTLASAAPEATITQSKVVRYADLDPANPADAARLLVRISAAAREVCRNGMRAPVQLECYDAAVSAAVAKVNFPLVKTLFAARSTRAGHRGA
jgi:UrcA family protein